MLHQPGFFAPTECPDRNLDAVLLNVHPGAQQSRPQWDGADSVVLTALQQALSRLLGSAGVWLGQQQGQKAPARAVPPASDLTLSRLVGLLSTNDMDALALFENEADGLRARLGDAAMDQVGRLMDTLDFAAAARLLQGESAA